MEDALDDRAFAAQPYVEISETCLAEAAKTDPQAFGELYERYYPRVYRYTYHRLGHAGDAEDIAAQVFMKALEGLHSYNPRGGSFAPWIFRIARNSVIDHYRRRRQQYPLEDLEQESGEADPARDVLARERRVELHHLVQQLSPEQRDVVVLRYGADLTFPEIAAAMNKKEAAVRMLLHRGLRKLKAVIDDE